MSNYSEGEDFLPFPEFSDRTRSRLVSSFRASGRRASLLDSFRSFRRSANSSRGSEDLTDLASHYSWANADEINAQTGIFNKKSISKLLEDAAKRGRRDTLAQGGDHTAGNKYVLRHIDHCLLVPIPLKNNQN